MTPKKMRQFGRGSPYTGHEDRLLEPFEYDPSAPLAEYPFSREQTGQAATGALQESEHEREQRARGLRSKSHINFEKFRGTFPWLSKSSARLKPSAEDDPSVGSGRSREPIPPFRHAATGTPAPPQPALGFQGIQRTPRPAISTPAKLPHKPPMAGAFVPPHPIHGPLYAQRTPQTTIRDASQGPDSARAAQDALEARVGDDGNKADVVRQLLKETSWAGKAVVDTLCLQLEDLRAQNAFAAYQLCSSQSCLPEDKLQPNFEGHMQHLIPRIDRVGSDGLSYLHMHSDVVCPILDCRERIRNHVDFGNHLMGHKEQICSRHEVDCPTLDVSDNRSSDRSQVPRSPADCRLEWICRVVRNDRECSAYLTTEAEWLLHLEVSHGLFAFDGNTPRVGVVLCPTCRTPVLIMGAAQSEVFHNCVQ